MFHASKRCVGYQIKQGNSALCSQTQYPLAVTVKDLNYPYQSYCKDLLLYQFCPY